MRFRNKISDEILTHYMFTCFVWEETERQFKDFNKSVNWCDLTKDEQIWLYCQQYEHQLNDRDWEMICDEKENN